MIVEIIISICISVAVGFLVGIVIGKIQMRSLNKSFEEFERRRKECLIMKKDQGKINDIFLDSDGEEIDCDGCCLNCNYSLTSDCPNNK